MLYTAESENRLVPVEDHSFELVCGYRKSHSEYGSKKNVRGEMYIEIHS